MSGGEDGVSGGEDGVSGAACLETVRSSDDDLARPLALPLLNRPLPIGGANADSQFGVDAGEDDSLDVLSMPLYSEMNCLMVPPAGRGDSWDLASSSVTLLAILPDPSSLL